MMPSQEITLAGSLWLVSEWAIRLIMLLVVPYRRTPAAAKSWLLLIFFMPWLGLILFLLIGSNKLPAWRRQKIAGIRDVFLGMWEKVLNHPTVIQPEIPRELRLSVKLAENLGTLPIMGNNHAEILTDYQGIVQRLITDIDGATDHVHLLYYIFAVDHTTKPIIEALGRAAERGVTCRVLVDSLGSRSSLTTLLPMLKDKGVEVHELLPIGLFRRKMGRVDLRNHRKIAVIDGQIGFTGSQNLVDAEFKPGIVYEELVVRVTGPIVLQLQLVFLVDWYLDCDEVLDKPTMLPAPKQTGEQSAQLVASGPGFERENNQRLFVALIHGAEKRVVITTPYFIPDTPLIQAMETAVMRGVDVHLIVSEKEDQLLVSLAQKSYYKELLLAGVKIHLYEKNFLHAKHMTIDDQISIIGSSNMDIRSFMLNAELSLVFYDHEVTKSLTQEHEQYFEHCKDLILEDWQRRPFPGWFFQYLARLMSPLL